MRIETLQYDRKTGWSAELPDLDSPSTMVLVFGAPSYMEAPGAIEELVARYPSSCVAGCSTSGEIFGREVRDDTLSVGIVQFEHGRVRSGVAPAADVAQSFAAGESLAASLLADDLRAVLVFSDGLNINGSQLVNGLNHALPESVTVTGGLAGDGDRFERTWVIKDGRPQVGWLSAVGLYGDRVRVGHGSQGGWDLFGPERLVTKAQANVLYELDDKPALDVYKRYLGDRADGLPATGLLFPLSLRASRDDGKRLVRTILAVDEETKSMTFAGDIPEGCFVQLMRANFERLVDGASGAAELVECDGADDRLVIAISCVGRRLVLGERIEDEVEATLDTLPPGSHQVGFYSYGEISPHTDGSCDLHNQTMTLTAISESTA